MTAQYWRHDPVICHESPHALLLFSLSKELRPLTHTSINLPSDDDGLDNFGIENANEIDNAIGPSLDFFYSAIHNASRRLNLVQTHKGYGRLKFNWTEDDYDEYKTRLRQAHDLRGVDSEAHHRALRETRQWWMCKKQA